METYRKIRDIIIKDVDNANETKRASVIMRFFALIMCGYFLLQGICMVVCGEWNGFVMSLLCLAGYMVAFYYTYLNHTRTALIYTIISTLAWVVLYVFLFGWDCGAQHFISVLLLLFFVASHAAGRQKVMAAVMLCALRLALYWYTKIYDPLIEFDPVIAVLMQMINTITIFSLITAIIMVFCQDSIAMEEKLVSYNEKLREASRRDPLTKLYNRRAMLEYITALIGQIHKHGHWFCIAIGDIDFFKNVNDSYGHEAGDAVLVRTAALLSECMSGKGSVCRWGGEEFLLVFEEMNGEEALAELEKIRELIQQQQIMYKGRMISVTMTFGLDEYDSEKPIDNTINQADQKLYMGKRQGRNRVVF